MTRMMLRNDELRMVYNVQVHKPYMRLTSAMNTSDSTLEVCAEVVFSKFLSFYIVWNRCQSNSKPYEYRSTICVWQYLSFTVVVRKKEELLSVVFQLHTSTQQLDHRTIACATYSVCFPLPCLALPSLPFPSFLSIEVL